MRVSSLTAASAGLAIFSAAALADDKSGCLDDKDRELQIKACSAILQRDAKDAIAYYKRGLAYQFKGDLDRAITDYNKAIELRPRYARAYESRGSAYAGKGIYTNAVADVTRAAELARKKASAPKTTGAIKKSVKDQAPNGWLSWTTVGAGEP